MSAWEQTEAHREAAEVIRAHLVSLRGGAPFLSPIETQTLDEWLQGGLSVPVILEALEAVADSRRKSPRKTPFTLDSAKRRLTTLSARVEQPRSAPRAHPLSDLASQIRASALDDRQGEALRALASSLCELPADDPHQLRELATPLIAAFHEKCWQSQMDSVREARLTRAREDLQDLEALLDPDTFERSVEERARADLRRAYPSVTVTALTRALFS
ncbi:MAG: hypothetical protein EA397_10000 [Deltaproteobacteria bacterium]|nr:MAG: hypothetical protein EA397_10000 [Deltaproteobacteria bacterium]